MAQKLKLLYQMNKVSLIICFLYCFGAISQDTLFLSVNNLLELNKKTNLTIEQNNINYIISKADLSRSVGDVLPSFAIGLRTYDLSGYTQATQGDILNVNKNNQLKGLAIQAQWDLGDLVFNFMEKKEEKKVSFFTNKLNNIEEAVEIYKLAYNLIGSQEKEKAIQQFIIKNQQLVSELKLQVKAGISLESDLLLAQSNLNNLKINLSQQKNKTYFFTQHIRSKVELNDRVDLVLTTNLFKNIDYTTFANIDMVIQERCDVQLQNHKIKVAKNETNRLFVSLLLPTLELGYNNGDFGFINENSFGNQNVLTTSLMWKIPLVNILPHADFRKQSSVLKIRLLENEQLKKDIKSKLNIVSNNFKASNGEYLLAEESFLFTQKAYEQCLQRQQVGTATQLEVFYSQKEYLNANVIYINTIINKHICGFVQKVEFEDKVYSKIE